MESGPTNHQFTAAQIAAALRVAKSTVLQLLTSEPTGVLLVRGHKANTWRFDALPAKLRTRVQAEADRLGYRNAPEFLLSPKTPWEPSLPLSEVAPHCIERAIALQKALRPMLAKKDDTSFSESEFAELGSREYQAVFGHPVSVKHWRELFNRTVERDRGFNDFERLEIFLDEKLTPKQNSSEADPIFDASTHRIAQLIGTFKNPSRLAPHEEGLLWAYVFEEFDKRCFFGESKKKLKGRFVVFLSKQAPFLRSTVEGVRKQFERKYQRYVENGCKPVQDMRSEKSGRYRTPQFSEEDLTRIKAEAVFKCGGRISQAFRELVNKDELSPELLAHYSSRPNKSYVPEKIREAVKHDVALCNDIHHGPRQARLNGPHIERDWSKVFAGDWHCQDDITWPVYWFERDRSGKMIVRQGQSLLAIDSRSLRVLGFVLLSSAGYDSMSIRTLNTKVFEEHGLPRKGFYFEGGIWEKSKLLKGVKHDPEAETVDLNYAETGLRGLGLRFVHSRLPRSKPVELVIGLLQNRMEGFLGYRGRNFTIEKFEAVEKAKLAVEAGRLSPDGRFYSKEKFVEELHRIITEYNAEPQEGKLLNGLSPDQAYQQFQNVEDPPVKFDARCRHLMAYHRKPVTVTRKGVAIRIGKRVFRYYDEQTGELQGQRMLAWFNPEDPAYLVLTDLEHNQPRTIELAPEIDAMDAPDEQITRALQRTNAHLKPAKALYRILKASAAVPHRLNYVDRKTAALGLEITQQRGKIETQRRTENTRAARIEQLQRELGMEGMAIEPTAENEKALLMARDADLQQKRKELHQ